MSRLDQAQLESLPLAAEGVEDIYTWSPMQQGMLFHTLYEQAAGDYINQVRVTAEAWTWHASSKPGSRRCRPMRCCAHGVLGRPAGVAVPGGVPRCASADRSADWRAMPERELELNRCAQRRQGFDLAKAPLRLLLVRTDEQRHELIYTYHHILMDGWSNSRLFGEVLQRYAGVAVPEVDAIATTLRAVPAGCRRH